MKGFANTLWLLSLVLTLAHPLQSLAQKKNEWWSHGPSFVGDPKDAKAKIDELLRNVKSPDAETREKAAGALGEFGPLAAKAIPALEGILKTDKEPPVREAAVKTLAGMALAARPVYPTLLDVARTDTEASVRREALRALVAVDHSWHIQVVAGKETVSAVQIFDVMAPVDAGVLAVALESLRDADEHVRQGAAETLALIGPQTEKVISALADALKDTDAAVRQAAVQSLGLMERASRPAVPAIAKLLKDESPTVRLNAAIALWQIDRRVEETLPVLVAALKTPAKGRQPRLSSFASAGKTDTPEVSLQALLFSDDEDLLSDDTLRKVLEVLGEMGPQARSALPAVKELLKDRSAEVRVEAAQTYWKVDPDERISIPVLVAELKRRGSASYTAAEYLAARGAAARDAVPVLCALLQEGGRLSGVDSALVAIGREAMAVVVPPLTDMLRDPCLPVRMAAADSLLKIDGKQARAVLPVLLEGLKAHDRRYHAVALLSGLGAEAKAAVPALTEILKKADDKDRLQVAHALWKIEREPTAVTILTRSLADEELRFSAVSLLGDLGPAGRAAIPELIKFLQTEFPLLREQVAITIWRIDPREAATMQEVVRKGLRDPNYMKRFTLMEFLAELSADARPLVPDLLDLLKDNYPTTRWAVAKTLKRIAPEAATKAGLR